FQRKKPLVSSRSKVVYNAPRETSRSRLSSRHRAIPAPLGGASCLRIASITSCSKCPRGSHCGICLFYRLCLHNSQYHFIAGTRLFFRWVDHKATGPGDVLRPLSTVPQNAASADSGKGQRVETGILLGCSRQSLRLAGMSTRFDKPVDAFFFLPES